MNGFSADWLALREPFDRAARERSAAALDVPGLAGTLRARRLPGAPLAVIDLACGTGANLRELAPRLGGRQRWRLIDHDPALLAALPAVLDDWARERGHRVQRAAGGRLTLHGEGFEAEVHLQALDLARGLDPVPVGDAQLVTASALLDLVSAAWLDALVGRCVRAGAAMLFALNVDGRHDWTPGDPEDAAVQRLFAEHQQRDKGFGAALGATAAERLVSLSEGGGCRIRTAASDWTIDVRDGSPSRSMWVSMVEGIAAAAAEQATTTQQSVVQRWKERRLALGDQGRLCIGHLDVLALPLVF